MIIKETQMQLTYWGDRFLHYRSSRRGDVHCDRSE